MAQQGLRMSAVAVRRCPCWAGEVQLAGSHGETGLCPVGPAPVKSLLNIFLNRRMLSLSYDG